MQRTLKVDRLYSLGDYKNIHISDEITEIPESLMLKKEVIGLIRDLQLLSIEKTFQHYLSMSKKYLIGKSSEDSEELLSQLQSDTMSELIKLLKNGNTEN